jgi:hypothetical protein
MITVPEVVEELIVKSPFLEEALADGLINVSSLARKLRPEIEQRLGREVRNGAIVMAINRMSPSYYFKINTGIKDFIRNIGDIIVRSDLRDFTFENSPTLIEEQSKLLDLVSKGKELFFTFSQGVYETTIIVSESLETTVSDMFANEKLLAKKSSLSSITIKLPKENTEISGLYYFIFKKLAWDGINILEVISTTNEFTIVVDDDDVDRAFSILMTMKKKG